MELSIDVETYCACPIKYGAQRYVDDTTYCSLPIALMMNQSK